MNQLANQNLANLAEIKVHEDISLYSPEEAFLLAQAYDSLEPKAQGGNLNELETRVRVAYVRYKRQENFEIAVKTTKATKEPKIPKEKVSGVNLPKKTRQKKVKEVSPIEKASQLLFRKNKGEVLSEEDEAFLQVMMSPSPELSL